MDTAKTTTALLLLLSAASPVLAQELPPGLTSAELLPGWITPEGHRMTGLHIQLQPGWKTYWRSPGDTGIPPRFDWQGSGNLGEIKMHWPRPEVIRTGDGRILGYHDSLTLPIEITPATPGQPVELRAMVDFGVCLDICVPVEVALTAEAPWAEPDPRITDALARQPRYSDLQPECSIVPIGDGMQVTALVPVTDGPANAEVAIETTQGDIWVSSPTISRDGGELIAQADFIAASGKPFPLDPDTLRMTLIGVDDAVELRGCQQAKGVAVSG